MIEPNYIFVKCTWGYKFSKSQKNINHLIYIDDLKKFAKNEKNNWDPITKNKHIQPEYKNGI